MAKTTDNRGGDDFPTGGHDAPLGQLISMFEWRVPDADDPSDPPARVRPAGRRADRDVRRVAQAARQLAGAIRRGDTNGVDWWQSALADLEIA